MDTLEILNFLPHRHPLLLVDRLTEFSETHAIGVKQLSRNEWFFQGHFDEAPEMPVSLLLESMGQAGAAAVLARPENLGKLLFLAGLDQVTIAETPLPAQTLRYEVQLLRIRGQSGKTLVRCFRGESEIASAEYTFVLSDAKENEVPA